MSSDGMYVPPVGGAGVPAAGSGGGATPAQGVPGPWRADMRLLAGQMRQVTDAQHWATVRTRRYAYAAYAAHVLAMQGRSARRVIEFRSQYGEDVTAFEMLGPQTKGFYVEAGAFDGRDLSVTYAFDAMGWDGLLVEPLPERAEACARNRPTARVVHAALGGRGASGEATLNRTRDPRGGMFSYTGQRREALVAQVHNDAPVRVPQTSLDALLAGHTGPIDLVVLDVEGAELDVLAGFDLRRWRPRVLVIEDNTRGQDQALTAYMKDQPYKLAGVLEVNRFYALEDEPALIGRGTNYSDMA
jgi:FkbM family methyltransferase